MSKAERKNLIKFTTILVVIFAVLLAAVLLTNAYLLSPYTVVGTSMQPNYEDGKIVFISKTYTDFKTGDVIVFERNNLPQGDKNLIKRVIAVAGDSMYIDDKCVYLNGKLLDELELYNVQLNITVSEFQQSKDYVVPEGHVFVMGDNRQHSSDSRSFGAISIENILGKVL